MSDTKQLPDAFCEKVRQLAFELEQEFGRPLAVVVTVPGCDTFAVACVAEESQEATVGMAIADMGTSIAHSDGRERRFKQWPS